MTSNLAWLMMLWNILCWTAAQKWRLLMLGNVLRETGGQIQLLGFRYASYEVTIPRKLTPRYGQQSSQDVSYLLQIKGKGHLVHLSQRKGFVPKHFPVFTYSKKGHLQVDYPFIKDDCFYHGFVQDQDFSMVALSTCSGGLRGLLSFRNNTYEIEPVQESATFQHMVYHLERKEGGVLMRCGLTEEEQRRQEVIIQNTENVAAQIVSEGDWWTHTRYVKVAIVVEHQRYIREKTSVCDLPEYCNGTSKECPEDVYVQDGAPCSDGAYCYHGNCTTHKGQCKMIFGMKATVASNMCFREMNTHGDRFGNCGLKYGRYDKCKLKNILCGRIQCDNVRNVPFLEEHNTVVQTAIGNKQCWSTDYHSGMKTADIGTVRDGTPCGTDMMCIAGQCKHVSLLKYDCDVTKCQNRGICNNRKHCHCDYGWTPPDCLKEGYGGSVDSGPPPQQNRDAKAAVIIGSLLLLFAAVVLCLCFYFRYILMQHLRRLRERFHPMKSKQEGISE